MNRQGNKMVSSMVNEKAKSGGKGTLDFDVERIRKDFPILQTKVHGKPLVYLDNAATTQKPKTVIDTLVRYYTTINANIHRGVHHLSEKATADYEESRKKVKRFLNAAKTEEIIFVRGATEGINLVAHSFGKKFIQKGDEIIISHIEHHSNIVPWQILCAEKEAKLKVIPVNHRGELILEEYEKLLSPRTKLVSVGHVSNSIGTINPIKKIIARAHKTGAYVLIDGAQAVPHMPVDVADLDCDFYVFSSHKIYGPTGVGVLYGKEQLLNEMPPYQSGGDMISFVTFEKTHYNTLPFKFEAGTPNIAGIVVLGAVLDYVSSIGMERIAAYEQDLLAYATKRLTEVEDLRIIGTAKEKAAIVSFTLGDIHAHDVGTILDREGIAIRTGHHCAMPVMERFGVPATARASFAFYNTKGEIDALAEALKKVKKVFGHG